MSGLTNLGAANIQGEYNKNQASKANRMTWNMQTRDMEFQRDMRATMYQDMVKDLKAAGLNPMLAYQKQGIGGSASGGSASAASIGMPQGSDFNPLDVFSAKQMNADAENKSGDSDLKKAQIETEKAKKANIDKDSALKEQSIIKNQPLTTFIKRSGVNETAENSAGALERANDALKLRITDGIDNSVKDAKKVKKFYDDTKKERGDIWDKSLNTNSTPVNLKWGRNSAKKGK